MEKLIISLSSLSCTQLNYPVFLLLRVPVEMMACPVLLVHLYVL